MVDVSAVERETWQPIVGAIGPKVREARQRLGLSLQQLAARAEVSAAAIHKVERGDMVPTITTLLKLAAALGLPIGHFVDDGARPAPVAQFIPAGARPEPPADWAPGRPRRAARGGGQPDRAAAQRRGAGGRRARRRQRRHPSVARR